MHQHDSRFVLFLCFALVVVSVSAALVIFNVTVVDLEATRLRVEPGDGRVILVWEHRRHYDGWEYRQQSNCGQLFNGWRPAARGPDSNSYVVEGLINGQGYHFQVRGISGARRGPPSNWETAIPRPTAPPDVCAEAVRELREIKDVLTKLSRHITETNPIYDILRQLDLVNSNVESLGEKVGKSGIAGSMKCVIAELKAITNAVNSLKSLIGSPCDCDRGETVELGEVPFAHDSDDPFHGSDGETLAANALAAISQNLKKLDTCGSIVLEGNASASGPPSYNLDLSQRRAQAVRQYFVPQFKKMGCLSAVAITAKGERHDEATYDRDEERDRRVRVLWNRHDLMSLPSTDRRDCTLGVLGLTDQTRPSTMLADRRYERQ